MSAASQTGGRETATYVYGVVRASEAPKIEVAGVGGRAAIRDLTRGALTAITHPDTGSAVPTSGPAAFSTRPPVPKVTDGMSPATGTPATVASNTAVRTGGA